MHLMKLSFFALVAVVVAGCVGPSRGYMKEGENFYGRTSKMSAADKARAVNDSVQRLLTDPMFTELYDKAKAKAKAAGRPRPILVVHPIENNTGDGLSDSESTGQMYRDLITIFRKTRLFTLRDRLTEGAAINDVMKGNDNGETMEAAANFGTYAAPDFVMTGQLRREFDDDPDGRRVYTHNLNLQMTDTWTKDIFWSETISLGKFGW